MIISRLVFADPVRMTCYSEVWRPCPGCHDPPGAVPHAPSGQSLNKMAGRSVAERVLCVTRHLALIMFVTRWCSRECRPLGTISQRLGNPGNVNAIPG